MLCILVYSKMARSPATWRGVYSMDAVEAWEKIQRSDMQRWWYSLFAFLLISCQSAQAADPPYVDLSKRTALPETIAAAHPSLKMAVAAILSPQGTVESYRELADYLGDALARPVELVQRRTYAEVNTLVAEHSVELAFVCTSAYLDGAAAQEMELLVAPEIDGQSVYSSQLIVPANSAAQTLSDLRGKTFAFTDPMSLTGRVYPTSLVRQMGQEPATRRPGPPATRPGIRSPGGARVRPVPPRTACP